ncbi:hypothetical protein BO78DRAFT_384351 [Aspergillus sclerotiicarbonarius CBS 121057]|uniref:Uncharacterized protein n=1 Tax=Aspergillus sclerotiicarbonarius (strain CBS 121057 / IBT 28362) TaxID=1448318 RepID=A0A319EGP4_ASPSB|nr:hypothetical protein BO78DRAFT_384351 [Aspergillus sclerotiicarbonarius CBS 121057]
MSSQSPSSSLTGPAVPDAPIHNLLMFQVGKDPDFVSGVALLFDLLRIPYALVGEAGLKITGVTGPERAKEIDEIQNFEFVIEDIFLYSAIYILETAGFPQTAMSPEKCTPGYCPPQHGPDALFHVPIAGAIGDTVSPTHRHLCLYRRTKCMPTLSSLDTRRPRDEDLNFRLAHDRRFPDIRIRHLQECMDGQTTLKYDWGRYLETLHPVKTLNPGRWMFKVLWRPQADS